MRRYHKPGRGGPGRQRRRDAAGTGDGDVDADGTDGRGVSAGDDGFLVWETNTGLIRRKLEGHVGDVYSAQLFPSGIVVLSCGADMLSDEQLRIKAKANTAWKEKDKTKKRPNSFPKSHQN